MSIELNKKYYNKYVHTKCLVVHYFGMHNEKYVIDFLESNHAEYEFLSNHIECIKIMEECSHTRNLDIPCIDTALYEDV